jgi:hypothetical protein
MPCVCEVGRDALLVIAARLTSSTPLFALHLPRCHGVILPSVIGLVSQALSRLLKPRAFALVHVLPPLP